MGTAVVSLFAFFLVIGTTMTAVNTVLKTGSDNAEAQAVSNEQLVAEVESSIALVSAEETSTGGISTVDVVLTNNGRSVIHSYEEWDVTVRYDQAGVVADPITNTFVYDAVKGKEDSIVAVSGDIYAIAYSGDGDDGWLITVDISSDGTVNSIVDSYEFDADKGKQHHIQYVAGNIYAVAYSGDTDDGWIVTLEIATDGTITKSLVDSWEFDAVKGKTPFLFKLASGIWAIAYSGDGDDGWLGTVTLSDAGAIGSSFIDSWEFDEDKGKEIDVLNISGDVFALGYSGDTDDGWLLTTDIATDGTITKTAIDSWEFDATKGKAPDLIHIWDDVYAVAYSGNTDYGWLFTVDIASDGTITKSFVDSLEYEPTKGKDPQIIHRDDEVYVISYNGPNDDGYAATFSISTTGEIGATAIDTLEFDTDDAKKSQILQIDQNIFMIAYSSKPGGSDTGKITTIDIHENGEFRSTWVDEEITLVFPYATTETDNWWTDQSFWLDHGNSAAELIEPSQLNQHEEMVMRIKLDPEVQSSESGEVTVTTPTGQTTSIFFDG
jgi:hypothetical protein